MKLKIFSNLVVLMFLIIFSYFNYDEWKHLNLECQKVHNFSSEIFKIKNFIQNQDLKLNNKAIFLRSSRINIKNALEKLNNKCNLNNFNFKCIEHSKLKILSREDLKNCLKVEISFNSDNEKTIFEFLNDLKDTNLISIESLRISEDLKVILIINFFEIDDIISNYFSSKNVWEESQKERNSKKANNEIYLFSHHPEHTLLCILNNQAYVVTASISDQKIISKKWMKLNDFIGNEQITNIDTEAITLTINYSNQRTIKLGEKWF